MLWLSCVFAIVIALKLTTFSLSLYCADYENRIKHEYYPLRHCQRSNRSWIVAENFDNVQDCVTFARINHGLAFNFGDKRRGARNLFEGNGTKEDGPIYNCQVLDCPEFLNFTTLVNDTRFDYYSLYSNPAPLNNATCLPSIGVFSLQNDPQNYTMALRFCRTHNGMLAHILSYKRTTLISQLLNHTTDARSPRIDVAFVGLNETEKNRFRNADDEPIDCFRFRAWAPLHPVARRMPGCVAITNDQSWKIFNCNKRLPFVCEILSSGPNPVVELKRKCSTKRSNNRWAPKRSDLETSFQ